jgi:hypothetical protein
MSRDEKECKHILLAWASGLLCRIPASITAVATNPPTVPFNLTHTPSNDRLLHVLDEDTLKGQQLAAGISLISRDVLTSESTHAQHDFTNTLHTNASIAMNITYIDQRRGQARDRSHGEGTGYWPSHSGVSIFIQLAAKATIVPNPLSYPFRRASQSNSQGTCARIGR